MKEYRVGNGYDVHQLAEGHDLWLGGIKLEHTKGCVAHSDGDVIIHAMCDALLGAAALGDIGVHFPDNDNRYKGIDSKILLSKTMNLIREKGYELENIDSTIMLQRPKVKEVIPNMVKTLAEVMAVDPERVSIKATTTEKLGFVGREEGVAVSSVALLYKYSESREQFKLA